MPVLPTWDLFIVAFFAIIMAYSFIVGKNQTLKIIISTYVAILTSEGVSNIIDRFFLSNNPIIGFVSLGSSSVVMVKILVFVLVILLLTIRGEFFVETSIEHSPISKVAANGVFGFLSAGLIVSTILVYMSGGSFLSGVMSGTGGIGFASDNFFIEKIIQNYNLWFSLPAVTFLLLSLLGSEKTVLPDS